MTRIARAVDPEDLAAFTAAAMRALDGDGALALGVPEDLEVPDGIAVVIATSGSTGVPKRVMLRAEALGASADATARRLAPDAAGGAQWMLALPAGYVAGLQVVVRSILAGTEPVHLDGRFAPGSFVDATRAALRRRPDDGPLLTSLVPAQLGTLLGAAAEGQRGLRSALAAYDAILIGGQALPEQLRDRAAAAGVRIVRTYGSSETSGGCVYDGVPLDDVRVQSVDGELRIAGPTLSDGYLGDPALTDEVFETDAEGVRWYRTGDLGIVEDGVVRVHGRADNVIVSGGINVSLDRVERIVRGVPGLTGAVVVATADARWGEASVIVAPRGEALRRSESEQLRQAREAVAAEIGAHARPARLVLVDELAMLSSGKPDREAIRRLLG
ncbi:AMP-binding protein [Microbacterium sp.]|uniref:AMP-binding protein n=1 Tax=Microbacterium sp. TaxID=51671 RepID=UPI003342BB06